MATVVTSRPATRVRTGVVGFFLAVVVAAVIGWLLPNHVIEPMDSATHFMGLSGPENPATPWISMFVMSPMILAYGMIFTSKVAHWLPSRTGDVGLILVAVATAAVAAYLIRWAIIPLTPGGWHGTLDMWTTIAYAAASIPAVAGGYLLVRDRTFPVDWVVAAAILLHLGMLPAMWRADLLGGASPAHID